MKCLGANLFVMMITMAGNDALSVRLMTRPSDGAAVCALDPPTVSTKVFQGMPEAPEAVRCCMTCNRNVGCKRFNYVSTESNPCQLYNYNPATFDVVPNCQHYYEPGQRKLLCCVNLPLVIMCHIRIIALFIQLWSNVTWFMQRMRCLSVCLHVRQSVTFVHCVKTSNRIIIFFHNRVATPF